MDKPDVSAWKTPINLTQLITNKDWEECIKLFDALELKGIEKFLEATVKHGIVVFPPQNLVFNALNNTSPKDIKVVILGQDCYHKAGQAMGLSFSVPQNVSLPSSLNNIFKEIKKEKSESGEPIDRILDMRTDTKRWIYPIYGDLTDWAKQGVLLLNCALTVQEGKAGSHLAYWKSITDQIISYVSETNTGVVFMLWGAFALGKRELINEVKHKVLVSSHPSGYSANSPLKHYSAFIGNGHFKQANEYLVKAGKTPINW